MKLLQLRLVSIMLCLLFITNVYATIEITSKKNASNDNCNGSIEMQATGDAAPFDVIFEGEGQRYTIYDLEGTYLFSDLCAGDYTITVGSNDCEKILRATIVNCGTIDLGNISITEPATCNSADGAVEVVGPITGGTAPYSFFWSNGQETNPARNLEAGAYTLTVTDVNGCRTGELFVFQSAGRPMITGTAYPTCEGQSNGTIELEVSNNNGSTNFSYNWSNGATSQNLINLIAGYYEVTVTDIASGCTTRKSFTIKAIPSEGDIVLDPIIQEPCTRDGDAGSIIANVINGTPPYSYVWSNGTTTPGIYNISILVFRTYKYSPPRQGL